MELSADKTELLRVTNHDLQHRYQKGRLYGEFIFPDTVVHIGDSAFLNCRGLTHVTIPDSVKHIGQGAFLACESLTQVTIPKSVEHIGGGAFRNCTSLTQVTIPDSVKHIGDCAFLNCRGLTHVTIPDSVKHIDDCAFHGCTSLTQVTIPKSVEHIGQGAFRNCTGLTKVTIHGSVTILHPSAFDGCKNLKEIFIDASSKEEYHRIRNLFPPAQRRLINPLWVLREAQVIKQQALVSVAACSMTALTALLVSKILNYKDTIAGNHGQPVKKTTFFKTLKEDRFSALLSRPVSGSELSRLVPGLETGEPQIVKSLPKHAQMLRRLITQRAIELHHTVAHIPLPKNPAQLAALFKCVAGAALPSARGMFLNPFKQVKPSEKAPEASKKRKLPDVKPSDQTDVETPDQRDASPRKMGKRL